MKAIKLGVVMDPISTIQVKKDSTLAMLLEAQRRGWELFYMEQADLYLSHGKACARMRALTVENDHHSWYSLSEEHHRDLNTLDVILMRKDPPFDTEYIYTTYLLELAEKEGVFIANKPQSLRDANEKMFTMWFAECCPPTLVSRQAQLFRDFLNEHQEIVLKPLEGMGGRSVFRLKKTDPNVNVVIETLTSEGTRFAMAQQFIPEIINGDKRILMINGEPVPYALLRVPAPGESRGNLAAGAKAVGVEISERDRFICQQIGPTLKQKGLVFVGIDVIGDFLTEINVTSPTCIREIDAAFGINISKTFIDCVEQYLN